MSLIVAGATPVSSRGKRRRRHNRRVRRRTQMRPRHSPDASAPLKTKTKCTAARVPPLEKRAKTSPAAAAFSVHSPSPLPKVGSPYAHVFCCRQSHNNSSTTRNSCSERRGLQPFHEEPTAGSASNDCPCHPGSLWLSWWQALYEQHTVFKIHKRTKQASRPTPRNPPDTFSYLRAAKMFNSVWKYTGSSAFKTDQPSPPLYFHHKHLKVANFPVSLSLLKNSGLSHRR